MKHLVVGNGNLARDLYDRLPGSVLASRSMGHNLNDILGLASQVDVVWYTLGHGSVKEANADPEGAVHIHCGFPLKLAKVANRLMYFSTDYVKSLPNRIEPKSMYALSKWMFESTISRLSIDNVTIFRVGSLYGQHKPHKTFIHRMVEHNKHRTGMIEMPTNVVAPTPTSWIAEEVIRNLDCTGEIYEIAPSSGTTVWEWAQLIWPEREIIGTELDKNRPEIPTLVHSFGKAPSWEALWEKETNFWRDYVRKLQR